MQRMTGYYFITLTFYNSVLDGLKRSKYEKFAQKEIDRLENWFRTKAKRKGWGYQVTICPSAWVKYTNKKLPERLHIHMLIKAIPACTMSNEIIDYWKKTRKLGKICEA